MNGYVKFFNACDYSLDELLRFDESALRDLFPSHTTIKNDRYDELMTYFERINQSRNHPGFTFLYHYNEYCQQASAPYGYTQFMEHYRRKYAKVKGSMKLEHEAGKEMFIDFAGTKLHITNKRTGELIPVEVFVSGESLQ